MESPYSTSVVAAGWCLSRDEPYHLPFVTLSIWKTCILVARTLRGKIPETIFPFKYQVKQTINWLEPSRIWWTSFLPRKWTMLIMICEEHSMASCWIHQSWESFVTSKMTHWDAPLLRLACSTSWNSRYICILYRNPFQVRLAIRDFHPWWKCSWKRSFPKNYAIIWIRARFVRGIILSCKVWRA